MSLSPLAFAWAWIGFVFWALSIAGQPDPGQSFRFSSYGGGGSEMQGAMMAVLFAAAGALGAIIVGAAVFREARVRPPWPVLPQSSRRVARVAGATAIALGLATLAAAAWTFRLAL